MIPKVRKKAEESKDSSYHNNGKNQNEKRIKRLKDSRNDGTI